MIDIKPIEDEINELSKQLYQKREELKKAKESNFKEQYGKDVGCDNCAYSCCLDVGDYHTNCTQYMCIHCHSSCDDYIPDNKLSIYIRDNHEYEYHMLDALNDLFDVSDIMQQPELHKKAIEILKLLDKKEQTNEE